MARILIGNIKGPKGDTGPQGPQGGIGPVGPQGPLPPLVNNALATMSGISALDAVMGKTLQDQVTQVNSNLNPVGTTKVDGGYVNVVLGANTWTGVNVPLNNKLSSVTYVQATPYAENPLRIFAPVVTETNTNSIRVAVYNQESTSVTIGLWVLAYGK